MEENNIALATRVHAAWISGEISDLRYVQLCNDIVGKSFDTPAGRELTRPGKSPLTAEQNYRLAKEEHALAHLRVDPDGEQVTKAAVVEKSDALLEWESEARKRAEESGKSFYTEFAAMIDEDPTLYAKAAGVAASGPHANQGDSAALIKAARDLVASSKAKGRPIKFDDALDKVASSYRQKYDRRGGKDYESYAM